MDSCDNLFIAGPPQIIVNRQVKEHMRKHSGAMTILALLGAFFGIVFPVASAQTKTAVVAEKSPPLPSGLDKRFLDTTADPCVNFAQYSCGNFTKLYPIPAYLSSYGTGTIVFEHTEQALRSLLEKVEADDPSRTPNEQKVGDFYAGCMNTDAIQAAGLKPLQPEFDRITALKDKSELTDLLAHYQLINVPAFFSYSEQQDFKDARQQIAVVDQGGLGLPERDYYLRTGDAAEKTRQQYVQHVTNMLRRPWPRYRWTSLHSAIRKMSTIPCRYRSSPRSLQKLPGQAFLRKPALRL
jgi:putative endopeptidase